MKISLNWLKEYVQTDLPVSTIIELLTNIGLEVEGSETIESIKGGLKGLVIGEVIECSKHPDAEKLSSPSSTTTTGVALLVVHNGARGPTSTGMKLRESRPREPQCVPRVLVGNMVQCRLF
jgi:hypothetical protein